MQINKISLKNFRKFSELDMIFQKGVNILIGDNAEGKTSILEALKVVLGGFFCGVNSSFVNSPSIHKIKDVRYVQESEGNLTRHYPVSIIAEGHVFDSNVEWSRELNTAKSTTTISGLSNLKNIVSTNIENEKKSLPIISFYSISRLKSKTKDSSTYKKEEKYIAYKNALEATANIGDFIKWFENEDRISYQEKSNTNALEIVCEAIKDCLPNCKRVFYDSKLSDVVIEDNSNNFTPFSFMSEGYKLTTSLVGDLIYRCVTLNPHLKKDCLKSISGVVLIDEIETHLHPSWQQRIVEDLKRVFPKIQFIISTHSPIILTGAAANIIKLDEYSTNQEKILAYGRKPDYVMYSAQGVDSRKPDIQNQINKFYELLESKEGLFEAKKILKNLFYKQFGNSDPDTVKAQRAYEFAEFEFENE